MTENEDSMSLGPAAAAGGVDIASLRQRLAESQGKAYWRSLEEIRDLIIAYYTERGSLPERADNNWRIVPPAAVETLKKELPAQ